MKKTWQRHIITPDERGHRPRVCPEEPTARYTIRLRQSTAERLRGRTERVRRLLDDYAKLIKSVWEASNANNP